MKRENYQSFSPYNKSPGERLQNRELKDRTFEDGGEKGRQRKRKRSSVKSEIN